jgi:glycosyltransferase involved in cell wall biosynthesis
MTSLFFVTPQFGRLNGGLGVSAERICQHLESEHQITLFVRDMTLPSGSYRLEENSTRRIVRFSANGEPKFAAQFLCDVISERHKVDPTSAVLAFYSGDLAFPALLAARYLQVPFATFGRGNDVDLDVMGPMGPALIHLWERSQKVFCVSREMESKIAAWARKPRTKYIPNSVDASFFAPQGPLTPDRDIVVGFLGDIKHKKGFEILLQDLPFERCRLKIVGHLRPESQKLLHGYLTLRPELSDKIDVTPFTTDPKELRTHLDSMDVVCVPSLHEGMPNVLLEAMAMEKVVVASDVGGNRDVIKNRENGFLFSPWQEGSFTQVITDVLDKLKAGELEALKKMARKTVLHFYSPKIEQKAYLKAIRSLLNLP